MALLSLDNNQTPNQQPAGGLLGNMNPEDKQMMVMAMVSGLMGRRRGGNKNGMQAMMQMQQAEANAARQQQMDALRFQEFGMRQNEYNRGAEKYQRDLDDYSQKKAAEKGLLDTINQVPDNSAPPPNVEQAAPQANVQPVVDQKQVAPAMPENAQLPMMEKPQVDPALDNSIGKAAQVAMSQNMALPEVPSAKDLQNAFLSVKPTDSSGNISQGAMQKRKVAGYLVQMGQSATALNLLKSDYGKPIAVANSKGEYKLIQINSDGEIKEVEGYNPIPKNGTTVRDASGNIIFEQGGWQKGTSMSPTKTTQNDLQKDVVGMSDQLNRLDLIAKDYKSSYLTYPGQIRGTIAKYANKITGQSYDKEYLQGMTRFNTGVEQTFNQYRKEITGAAAAIQELDRLKASMLNKDMSPDEFEAAYSQFKGLISRSVELKQKFLSQGIPLDSPEMGKMIDSELFSGQQSERAGGSNNNQQTGAQGSSSLSNNDPLGWRK